MTPLASNDGKNKLGTPGLKQNALTQIRCSQPHLMGAPKTSSHELRTLGSELNATNPLP